MSNREPSAGTVRAGGGERRAEILETAGRLFATAGFVRTTLKDVADACGILPGSLYHHFDSKESLAAELIDAYWTDLEMVGRSVPGGVGSGGVPRVLDRILELGTAIARCAARHEAALQLTLYEPREGATGALLKASHRSPAAINRAMRTLLRDATARGLLRPPVDLALLADHLCQVALRYGLTRTEHRPAADTAVPVLYDALMCGIAARPVTDAELDGSAAMAVARRAVASWSQAARGTPVRADLYAVARTEFARRGYEATTIRDIAAAAGVGASSIYRHVRSKEALLAAIMDGFHARVGEAYQAVLGAEATPIGRLDALLWLNINLQVDFREELQIGRAWLRVSPPRTNAVFGFMRDREGEAASVVREAVAAGEIGRDGGSPEFCVRQLMWVPFSIVEQADTPAAHVYVREVLLRGALEPGAR